MNKDIEDNKPELYKCPYSEWRCSMLEPCNGCEEFRPTKEKPREFLKPHISKNDRLVWKKVSETMKESKELENER